MSAVRESVSLIKVLTSLAALAGGLMIALQVVSCQPQLTELSGETMGTTWSLLALSATETTRAGIQNHLNQREAVLSHWKADSALSQFNASRSTDWFPVPLELVKVVKLAQDIALQTEGVLDVTVAPLVESWGFGPPGSKSSPRMPPVGWQHLALRVDPPALKKDDPELRINVAAVTEGFVIDELVAMLKQQGLTDFLLEVGGEVAAVGTSPQGVPWQVGVQSPEALQSEAIQTLPLTDQCIATSGSYRHRFEKDGRSFSHLIDPRTRQPITHRLVSVSVIHESCGWADGYATALMVLGPVEGREVARRLGLRVIWIEEP